MRLMQYDLKLKKANRYFHHEIPANLHTLKKIIRKTEHYLSVLSQEETNVYIAKWCMLTALLWIEIQWHETEGSSNWSMRAMDS
jgi:hypothetical protein